MSAPTEAIDPTLLAGRYRLRSRIGVGGMADVHLAEDETLRRPVAVKMVRSHRGTGPRTRVSDEMALLASLQHPSIVTLYDARVGCAETEFLVMEYVDGPTLADRLDGGPLPAPEVAAVTMQLAAALRAAHARGIVHRDVKPSNVLLAPAELPGQPQRAKLTDFGIAYYRDDPTGPSRPEVMGTAAYLAPEQVRGAEPSPAGDVYSLGLVALEALTGRRAFPSSDDPSALAARLAGPPEVPESVGRRWARLIRWMTSPDPRTRPTADEVVAAAAALAGQRRPVHADGRAPSAVGGRRAARRRTRRRRMLWGSTAVAAVAAVAVVGALISGVASPVPGTTVPVVVSEPGP
ncbi:serine/threonine-protein kinase [Microbacterium xanthum]|uniref:serine/threonine-protein kinase n=1 Tax=Microbacterium xanthum TaxID=3079794 RepID=UPI002AD36531|nr:MULTISPECIES: serine/threonine-protein kinase [unclassified Microbacterium]MDZ8171784.1 serine/threonine-protein kinase [Microbacterium sp. KSW-48]MDZ8200113.1 serine/threonine-protein kinase [Microbacterium sp. SSW1-59]